MLARPNLAYVHLGPPCGTSSRARDIKNHGPPPLRTDLHPDGKPNLKDLDARRVRSANALYHLSGQVLAYCCRHGILCTIENPSRSFAWQTSHLRQPLKPWASSLTAVHFHHCMFGSTRRKATKLLCNHAGFTRLSLQCDDGHPHEPWGRVRNGWATALEVAYPGPLCRAWALVVRDILHEHQAVSITELASQHLQLNCAARSAYNSQPRGKRLKPLVREVKHVIRLRGPASVLQSLPPCCKEPVTLSPQVTSQPALPALPAGSRLLHTHLRPGGKACEPDLVEATYGVPWEPEEFVTMAIKQGHPSHFIESVPTRLKRCIDNIASSSLATVAQERTEAMRYWTLRAKETRDRERAAMKEAPPHCRDVLKRKDLTLFDEILQSIDYDDVDLCNDMRKGFDLMGDIPGPPSFPQKTTFATLTPEQVREVASETRQAIMLSAQSSRDREMDRELLEITLDEVDRGWLEGPIDMGRLLPTATVSRRFGVRQGSTAADGTRVFKVQPIDDLSESLINMTNGGEVTISPMGTDAIVAGLVHRLRQKPGAHLSAKTIDLRKAYKNLPVSGPALQDSHLMVFDPDTNEPQVFLSKVLPFGARTSVMGFCRVAAGLWAAGVSIFHLHWTSYFDDFFLICERGEEVHLEMAQRLFFQLLGWETSHEKEAEFAELARVLGVEIDLASAHLGEVMIRNTIGQVQEITTQIDEILALGRHCRGELKVLRGRLQFAEQQCFGRSSAWMVRVLSDAAENLNPGIIQRDLHKALRFLRDRLVQAEPRKVSSQVGTTWMLFTDAAFEPTTGGSLGGVLYDGDGKIRAWYGCSLSERQCRSLNPSGKKTIISELEAFAVLAALSCLCVEIRKTLVPRSPLDVCGQRSCLRFPRQWSLRVRCYQGRGGVDGRLGVPPLPWHMV